MWCGPNAVEALLDGRWTRDQVWLHIRWLREQHGKRLTDRPVGGTTIGECLSAISRAGYTWERWCGLRMTYGEFRRTMGRRGRWLVRQQGHLFPHDARTMRGWPRWRRREVDRALILEAARIW